MEVKSIGNIQISRYHEPSSVVEEENLPQDRYSSDKIDISSEAKELKSNNVKEGHLEAVKSRVRDNYYNKPEVIEKVVDKILKEITG